MNRKLLLFVLLILVIISQLTVLSSFFFSFQAGGLGTCCSTIVVIAKQSYVYGWVAIDIQGPSSQGPEMLQFFNGTTLVLSSEYKFVMKLPRTGDCLCNGGGDFYGVSLSQSQPIGAVVLTNSSAVSAGFFTSSLPTTTEFNGGLYNVYWFVINGSALIAINGYGVAY